MEEEKYIKFMKEPTVFFGLSVVFCGFFLNTNLKWIDPIIPSAYMISKCTLISLSCLLVFLAVCPVVSMRGFLPEG